MKKGRLQCKDVPELPILGFLNDLNGTWANWFEIDQWPNRLSVRHAFPHKTPGKLVWAKMKNLIRKGFVDGCPCGCRGDYVLTERGKKELYK